MQVRNLSGYLHPPYSLPTQRKNRRIPKTDLNSAETINDCRFGCLISRTHKRYVAALLKRFASVAGRREHAARFALSKYSQNAGCAAI